MVTTPGGALHTCMQSIDRIVAVEDRFGLRSSD